MKGCTISKNLFIFYTHNPNLTAATGYISVRGDNSFLILNESLWMSHLDHSLINPNWLSLNEVEVQDNPFITKPMTITSGRDGFSTYLDSTGTIAFRQTWTPCQKELELHPYTQLSSPEP